MRAHHDQVSAPRPRQLHDLARRVTRGQVQRASSLFGGAQRVVNEIVQFAPALAVEGAIAHLIGGCHEEWVVNECDVQYRSCVLCDRVGVT